MSKKFWKIKNNADNDEESAELLLYGTIAHETWWGDEVTPKHDGSEVVAQMINIAKQNGNTAEEISEYVNAVKTQTANSSRDKGIAEIKKLVQDNISSGAAQITASPADNTANDIANQEKQKQFDDVLAAMNK